MHTRFFTLVVSPILQTWHALHVFDGRPVVPLFQAAIVAVGMLALPGLAQPGSTAFQDAQEAASRGHYEEVVAILTDVLETDVAVSDRVIALSNRGIAYSLQKRYGLAVDDLQQAIELEPTHLLSLNHLGILAENIERDYESAATWYVQAAILGYPASQVNLGNLYRSGKGVGRDPERAVALFEAALEAGYDVALVSLGEMYVEGEGVPRDAEKGLQLLHRGVAAGILTGHYMIGRAFEKGWGVNRDPVEAFKHYQLAALQGHAPSQGALGYLFRRGHGTQQDFVEAAAWYRLAADQGDVLSINRLAWLLATCPVKTVCNGDAAVQLALQATYINSNASHLDSLAAGHARKGEFDLAIDVIQSILDLNLTDAERKKYASRLDRYQNGIPFQL